MHVKTFRLQNFRCFEDLTLTLAKHVTLLVAQNGGGKTALLDGLAAALGGVSESLGVTLSAPLGHRDVRRTHETHDYSTSSKSHYPAHVEASLVFQDGTEASTFRALDEGKEWLRRPSSDSPVRQCFKRRLEEDRETLKATFPCMAYYRVGRARSENENSSAKDDRETSSSKDDKEHYAPFPGEHMRAIELARRSSDKTDIPERKQGWRNALNAGADWGTTRDWWAFEYLAAAAEGRPVSAWCRVAEVAVSQALAETEWTPRWSASDRDILVWVENQGPRPVGMLSDGYRATVGLFADLARRCALLNPHLGAEAAKQTPGVVLIDEIDLHLHPSWQRRFIADLRAAFPLMQFVLTTHSPQVLSGATAVLTKNNDKVIFLDTSQAAQPVPIELQEPIGLHADQVLTGPWFRLASSLDTETINLIEEHRRIVQKKRPTKKDLARKEKIEDFMRKHLGRFFDTHIDEVVHRVVTACLADRPEATWKDIEEAGNRALELLRKPK